jgi:hypothetical protein
MTSFAKVLCGLLLATLALLVATSARVPGQAPSVAGVSLGMAPGEVTAVLGAPELQEQSLGMRFWEYPRRGITVIWHDDAPGVRAIVLSKRNAGEIRGVRVGDLTRAVSDSWGPPVRVRSAGRFLDFAGRTWTLSAEIAKGKAIEITLLAAHSGD